MANSVYKINKGINASIEFKGLKAQYIGYMGIVVFILLGVFAFLYLIGINEYICLLTVGVLGMVIGNLIYKMSRQYGAHGLSKLMAKRSVPKVIKCKDRKVFMKKRKQ